MTADQQSARPSNGLGTAGFVVSLVGIPTCGIISPIGLILSLVALRKQPKGLAIAGSIIGGLGSLWLPFFGVAIVAGIPVVGEMVETQVILVDAAERIEAARTPDGSPPDAAAGAALIADTKDAWGHDLRYETSDGDFVVRSAGLDGKFGTADDMEQTSGS